MRVFQMVILYTSCDDVTSMMTLQRIFTCAFKLLICNQNGEVVTGKPRKHLEEATGYLVSLTFSALDFGSRGHWFESQSVHNQLNGLDSFF